jgi:hypothetical protein
MLYAVLAYVALCAVVLFLWYRLTKTREKLFAANRAAVRAQTGREASREVAQAAEERCRQALDAVGQALDAAEQALAQTGQALEVAGHIRLIGDQMRVITEYIAHPLDTAYPLPRRPGRHAITNGPGHHAVADGVAWPQWSRNGRPAAEDQQVTSRPPGLSRRGSGGP